MISRLPIAAQMVLLSLVTVSVAVVSGVVGIKVVARKAARDLLRDSLSRTERGGSALQQQIRTRCSDARLECEVRVGPDSYLVASVGRETTGAKAYDILAMQSIEAAARSLTATCRRILLIASVCTLLIMLPLSRSIAGSLTTPIHHTIASLTESRRTGRLRPNFVVTSRTTEMHELGNALNRTAEALAQSRKQLDKAYSEFIRTIVPGEFETGLIKRLDQAYIDFVESMAQTLDARDPYTAGHSHRVSGYAISIAAAMELPAHQIEVIRIGAELHDIGKIGIPDAVLQKPSRLTDEEYEIIKLHPQIGKRILEKVEGFAAYLPIVELHHEDYEGRGYPYGLKKDEVPLSVRIVHVADAYDAMTSGRAYRKPMPEHRAREILKGGAGTQFDPIIVDIFLSILSTRLSAGVEQLTTC